jgi:hypothetical protein
LATQFVHGATRLGLERQEISMKYVISALWVMLLAGCQLQGDDTDVCHLDSDDTDVCERGGDEPNVCGIVGEAETSGTACGVSGPDVSHTVLLATNSAYPSNEDQFVSSEERSWVLTEEEDYLNFQDTWGETLEAVDFTTHRVLAGIRYSGSTCGLETESKVVDNGGNPHLEVTFTDESGACCNVCDGSAFAVVAVSVESTATSTVCVRSRDVCD